MDLSGSKSGSDVDYIRQIIDRLLAGTHTSIPAIVESFDPATQMIECVPVIRSRIKDIDGNVETVDRPKLVKVPLITPYVHVLGFSFTLPIQPGDTCLLMFSERGLDYWQETGEISDPPEDTGARIHDITDGIAAFGPIAKPNAIEDYQTDSTEQRNRDRTSSVQLWDAKSEWRIKTGSHITQHESGDVDTKATANKNTGIDGDENTKTTGKVSRINESDEHIETTGTVKKVSDGESIEWGGARLIKKATGVFEIHSDVEVISKAPVTRICEDCIIQGDLVVVGDATISEKSFNTHIHGGVFAGTSETSPPDAEPGPGPDPEACPATPPKPSSPTVLPPVRIGP